MDRHLPRRTWGMLMMLGLLGLAQPSSAQPEDQLRHDVLALTQGAQTFYRGAPSHDDFAVKTLQSPESIEDLVRAVGSRLSSRSRSVSGLSSTPQVAASFALGVQDGNPNTIRFAGLSAGYVGVTEARTMPARAFANLLSRYGQTKPGLTRLLDTMAAERLVVDGAELAVVLAKLQPGIFTVGFNEMISSHLNRESEYLVFGKTPRFKRVVHIRKDDVIDANGSVMGAIFRGDLERKLTIKTSERLNAGKRDALKPSVMKTIRRRAAAEYAQIKRLMVVRGSLSVVR